MEEAVSENELLALRIHSHEFSVCPDTIGNKAVRVPHVEADQGVTLRRRKRASEFFSQSDAPLTIHGPTYDQRYGAFRYASQVGVRARVRDEALPQLGYVTDRPTLQVS
ncbi:hypothetical protein D3C78_1128070 [compost metagenome]